MSQTPAKEAGKHISELINGHEGEVICLLSGGSALKVVEHINVRERPAGAISECRTIFMMGDERGSRERDVNNSLQLQERYQGHPILQCFVPTIPEVNESLEAFAARVEKNVLQIISELQNVKIISLLGMGPDGHTAGIFPLPKRAFEEIYRDDLTYVPVHVEGLRIDSRASFTPSWLMGHVDAVIGYVTGEGKKMMLESLLRESKPLHERPAEIFKRHQNVTLYTDIEIADS